MVKAIAFRLAVLLCTCICIGGCGSSPTTPSANLEGRWVGTTAQGTPIAFTVSADGKVTSITFGFNFNGCSGSHTFSNLSLETAPSVTCIPGPCSPSISSYRAFSYASGSIDGPMTSINGLFLSPTTAEGAVAFRNYPECGTVLGVGWAATR